MISAQMHRGASCSGRGRKQGMMKTGRKADGKRKRWEGGKRDGEREREMERERREGGRKWAVEREMEMREM